MKITRKQLRQFIREAGRLRGPTKSRRPANTSGGIGFGTTNYAVDCDNVGKTNACAKVVRYREKFRNLSGEKLDNLETTHSCPPPDLEDICAEELADLKAEDEEKGKNVKAMMTQVKQSLRVDPISEAMKITHRQLRQIIKEELSLMFESPTDDYLDGLRAELQGKLIDNVSQSAQTRKLELSDEGIGEIQDALIDGVFKVTEKDEEEETATLVWEVEDFRGALIDSGIPEDDVDQVLYNLSFIDDLSVQKGALDAVFGEGSFDGISIGDMFADSAGLMDKISQRTKTPASKKEYNGPKGKGQTRYIVTSQVTKWHSEDEADFNMSVFFLVDTADGSKFKLKGSELPKTLPSTEGPIEIFNIAPSRDRDESDLVADINGKEFRLARKDI